MNNRYLKSLAFAALAAFISVPSIADTQDYARVDKSATYDYDKQEGEITLESYVTGLMKVTQEAKPVDVVLVLDYSSSMGDSYSTHNDYTKYVIDKKYYGGNLYILTGSNPSYSSSYSLVSNQTSAITTGKQLYSSTKSGTEIKVKYNGTDHNVYLLRAVSGSTYRNWAYVVDESDGNKRVFLRQDGSFVKEKGTVTVGYNVSSWPKDNDNCVIPPAHTDSRILFCTLSETTASTTTRTNALQAAAGNFIDEIAKHASDNNVTDRIAIVSFQLSGTNDYPAIFYSSSSADYVDSSSPYYLLDYPTDASTGTGTDGSLEGKSLVTKKFTDVSSNDATKFLKFAISGITAKGTTPVNKGLDIADKLVEKFGRKDSNVAKFVILFSDGEPTTTSSTGVWASGGVGDLSVASAHSLKKTRGYTVYSVYCNSASLSTTSNVYHFMDYCSSNYPDAELYTSTHGSKLASDKAIYFKTAQDDLGSIFADLTREITAMAGKQYGTDTMLKDFVNNTYFKMPEDIDKYDVKVYEQDCISVTATASGTVYGFDNTCDDATNRCWHVGATGALPDASTRPKLDITIQKVGDDGYTGTQDRVLITGYNYSHADNWCGLRKSAIDPSGTPGGHRLLVKFPFVIRVKKDSTATGALETNGNNSGIYEALEDSSGKKPGDSGYTPTYADTAVTEYPMPVVYFCSLVINRSGLDPGESAIYDIYQTKPGESERKVGRLSLNGTDETTVTKVVYGLAGGVGVSYRVQETDWNWAYHSGGTKPVLIKEVTASSSDPTVPASSSLTFDFTGAHQTAASGTEATSPFSKHNHDEEYKVNPMTIPTVTP